MMDLPQRKSLRFKGYDYSQTGWYYVTICTDNRIEYFGQVKDNKISLSTYGNLADTYWKSIPQHFRNIVLDEYIIMPNHIHGIIVIKNIKNISVVGDADLRPLHARHPQHSEQLIPNNKSKMLLSKIIHGFKSSVSRYCNKHKFPFSWHRSFFDHIIRNEQDYNRIVEYIRDNPRNWSEDELNNER